MERAFKLAEDIARRDLSDFDSQYRVFTAETKLAGILRHTDPRRALELYDDALQRLRQSSRRTAEPGRNEVATLTASTYPLRRLGRTAEAESGSILYSNG